jgi:hypothetical protein
MDASSCARQKIPESTAIIPNSPASMAASVPLPEAAGPLTAMIGGASEEGFERRIGSGDFPA